jgi:hypothetical protein
MRVSCYGSDIEVPDLLIEKFVNDFNALPGSGFREGVEQLRESINEVVDIVGEAPDLLHEKECLTDFIRTLAMKQALHRLGILYDA